MFIHINICTLMVTLFGEMKKVVPAVTLVVKMVHVVVRRAGAFHSAASPLLPINTIPEL